MSLQADATVGEPQIIAVRQRLELRGIVPDFRFVGFGSIVIEQLLDEGIRHIGYDLDGNLTASAYYHDEVDPDAEAHTHAAAVAFESTSLTTNSEVDVMGVVRRLRMMHCVQPYEAGGLGLPYKPKEEYWQGWLNMLGNPDPSTVLQVGDHPLHDLGAKAVGIKVALMDRWDPYGFFVGDEA